VRHVVAQRADFSLLEGITMSKTAEPKFNSMNRWQKCVFVGKIAVFLLTFGFAYPNILLD